MGRAPFTSRQMSLAAIFANRRAIWLDELGGRTDAIQLPWLAAPGNQLNGNGFLTYERLGATRGYQMKPPEAGGHAWRSWRSTTMRPRW